MTKPQLIQFKDHPEYSYCLNTGRVYKTLYTRKEIRIQCRKGKRYVNICDTNKQSFIDLDSQIKHYEQENK